jgi:hypothetical protein
VSFAGLEDRREVFAAAFFETFVDSFFEALFAFEAVLVFEFWLLRLAIIGSARGFVLMDHGRTANKAAGRRQAVHR